MSKPRPLIKRPTCCDKVLFLRIIGPDMRALVECDGRHHHISVHGVSTPQPISEVDLNKPR